MHSRQTKKLFAAMFVFGSKKYFGCQVRLLRKPVQSITMNIVISFHIIFYRNLAFILKGLLTKPLHVIHGFTIFHANLSLVVNRMTMLKVLRCMNLRYQKLFTCLKGLNCKD